MFHSTSARPRLEAKLRSLDARIAEHPLGSTAVKDAHAVITANAGAEKEVIARELAERGLPSLQELGSLQVRHSLTWWWLNRSKIAAESKLARLP